jgi:hypothetical protein
VSLTAISTGAAPVLATDLLTRPEDGETSSGIKATTSPAPPLHKFDFRSACVSRMWAFVTKGISMNPRLPSIFGFL